MKKGMKGNSLRHRLSPYIYSGFIASIIAFGAVAIVSMGTLIVSVCAWCRETPQGGNYVKDLGNIIISIISFLASVIGSWCSIVKLFHNNFDRQFLKDPEYEDEIKKTVGHNLTAQYKNNGYTWGEYKGARYLYSEKVDEALLKMFPAQKDVKRDEKQRDVLLKVSPKIQPLSADQSEALYQKVKQKRAEGKNIFNSNLVRLRTDMFINGVLSEANAKKTDDLHDDYEINRDEKLKLNDVIMVDVEKTDYYSNMISNDMIYDRLFAYDHSSVYYGKDMTVFEGKCISTSDKNDTTESAEVLYNLSNSPAANIIGVTTLAITKDDKLVINKQDNNNDVNNDCFVPSGSGSADFDDLKRCQKLEKKTKTKTYAEKLESLCKSYKSLSLRKNRKDYKIAVKNEIKTLKTKNTVNEKILKIKLKRYKDDYENGIKAKKEYKQLKRYCKKLKSYTCSFRNFITYGMIRELVEESHVCEPTKHKISHKIPDDEMIKLMNNTEICGYIRILDRGGKPDFFGITYLDYTQNELEEKFFKTGLKVAKKELDKHSALTDFSEVRSQIYISKNDLLNCNNFEELFPKSIDENTNKEKPIKISLQLHYLLTILKKKWLSEESGTTDEGKKD